MAMITDEDRRWALWDRICEGATKEQRNEVIRRLIDEARTDLDTAINDVIIMRDLCDCPDELRSNSPEWKALADHIAEEYRAYDPYRIHTGAGFLNEAGAQKARELYDSGMDWREAAKVLKTTPQACQNRWRRWDAENAEALRS